MVNIPDSHDIIMRNKLLRTGGGVDVVNILSCFIGFYDLLGTKQDGLWIGLIMFGPKCISMIDGFIWIHAKQHLIIHCFTRNGERNRHIYLHFGCHFNHSIEWRLNLLLLKKTYLKAHFHLCRMSQKTIHQIVRKQY